MTTEPHPVRGEVVDNGIRYAHNAWLSIRENLQIRNQAKTGIIHTIHLWNQPVASIIIMASVYLFIPNVIHSVMYYSFTQYRRELKELMV